MNTSMTMLFRPSWDNSVGTLRKNSIAVADATHNMAPRTRRRLDNSLPLCISKKSEMCKLLRCPVYDMKFIRHSKPKSNTRSRTYLGPKRVYHADVGIIIEMSHGKLYIQ